MCKIKNFFMKSVKKIDAAFLSLTLAMTFLFEKVCYAANLGDIADTVSSQFPSLAKVVKYGAFLVGFYLIFTGFNDMRQAREKQTTVGACAIKVAIGIILCSIMFFLNVGTETLGGSGTELTEIL